MCGINIGANLHLDVSSTAAPLKIAKTKRASSFGLAPCHRRDFDMVTAVFGLRIARARGTGV